MWCRLLLLVATCLLVARPAMASPSSRLVYVRGRGAETCPDEAALRAAVAARLGYDPFFPSAPKTVIAQVSRTQTGYRGLVQITLASGELRGERELATTGPDCTELVSALALAVSIALDDLDEPTPVREAPPEPEPEPVAVPEAPQPPPPAPPAPPPRSPAHLDLSMGLGASLSLGTAPAAVAGGTAHAMLGHGPFAARLGFRGEASGSKSIGDGGRVATHTVLGSLAGCVRGDAPFGCLGLGLGSLTSSTSGITRPATDDARVVTLVATAGTRFGLVGGLYLEPTLEGAVNLAPVRVEVDRRRAYTLSTVTGTLGLNIGLKIF